MSDGNEWSGDGPYEDEIERKIRRMQAAVHELAAEVNHVAEMLNGKAVADLIATRIRLVNSSGRVVAVLQAEPNGGGLAIMRADGAPAAVLSVDSGGGGRLDLGSGIDQPGVSLDLQGGAGRIILRSPEEKTVVFKPGRDDA